MARICLDYGHGGVDPGAVYRGRKEKDDNLEIGKLVAQKLRSQGVEVDETRTGDRTLSLKGRADFERRKSYDFFVSFHRNAYKPEKARGVETHIYKNGSQRAKDLGTSIQKGLVDLGFKNRGLKRSNFYVLRETRSPAILIEIGFIDNSLDNEIFTKNKDRLGEAISLSLLAALGIRGEKPVLAAGRGVYYRVLAGSFSSRANAEIRKKEIEAAGFQATIVTYEK